MKNEIGLWIDHRQAVIVVVTDAGEETKRVISNMEKHIRFYKCACYAGMTRPTRLAADGRIGQICGGQRDR